MRVTSYKVTPYIGSAAQPPVVFDSPATTQVVTGLTNGTTYTFRVVGIDALGNEGASSQASNPVTYTRPPATAVTGGLQHSCAVLTDGTARCWGSNDRWRLGKGSTVIDPSAHTFPVVVAALTDATAISAGWIHSCALSGLGSVGCWGYNQNGQLGNGRTVSSPSPVTVVGITDATAISAGGLAHSCAVLAGGIAKCWGYNVMGQLGNGFSGTSAQSSTPVSVTGITNATGIAAGYLHTCAVMGDGTVRCWGYNANGELGNGTTTNSSIPVPVSGVTDAVAITAGMYHSCALLADGTVTCWGRNTSGELGNGTTTDSTTPVPVVGITDAIATTAHGVHSCALSASGTMSCWGSNASGELGNGSTISSSSPVPVTGITDAVAITTGDNHSCAVVGAGTIQCWGRNTNGELGNGTTTDSSTPVPVSGW